MRKLTLRTTKKEGTAPLFLKMKVEGKSTWVDLRMTVDIVKWNDVSQTEKKLSNYLEKSGIGKKVALISDACTELRKHHNLTKDTLNETIENIVLADKREELKKIEQLKIDLDNKRKNNVKTFVVDYIQKIESGEARTYNKEKYGKLSCKNWNQFKRVFVEFYDKCPFGWDDINESWVNRFISFLESKGYMKSTLYKRLCFFRTLVGVAERQKLHTNHIACSLLKSPKVEEQYKTKKIYLNKEELSALYDMPLEGFYEQVRDVFLIGCFTALRFSDYCRINKSNIGTTASGTKVIRLSQKKTGEQVVIPIMDDRLEVLLKKYDYNVPNIWGESLNRAIKQICKTLSKTVPSLAEMEKTALTLSERKSIKKTGKDEFEYDEEGLPIKPRWKLVSSHTARRSCITNMYLSKKFSTLQMMSISGHKTESVFYKYIKLSVDEVADNVASAANDGLF